MMKYFSRLLPALLSGMLWFAPCFIQGQTPKLTADGQPHEEPFTGSHIDYLIPSVAELGGYDHIEFYLKGGDGGRRKVPNLCKVKGGEAATVTVRFKIGTGPKDLKPGGRIRFVVGKAGESNGSSGVEAGGGGGGTGILYRDPSFGGGCANSYPSGSFTNVSTCWILLGVAGGGGGAYSSGTCGGQAGKGGNSGSFGTAGYEGGNGGTGGNAGQSYSTPASATTAGGGGGFKEDSGSRGGEGGFLTGGAGGNAAQNGGWGYGGGGGADEGGGGGGGYSGGGGGGDFDGGGGGGSFANGGATYSSKTSGGTVTSPQNGKVIYTFKDFNSNTPDARCKDITVELDATGFVTFSADSSDDGSLNPLVNSLSFCYFSLFSCPGTITWDCSRIGSNPLYMVAANGVEADFCTSVVTVEDNIDPTASCKNIQVNLNASGEASITAAQVDDGSTDACGIAGTTVSPSTFDCSHVGNNSVTLTVEDNNENFNSCTANVWVRDQRPPTIQCHDATVSLVSGSATLNRRDLTAGSSDNCGLAPDNTVLTFTCADVGSNQLFTLSRKDIYNNTSSFCGAQVTVIETGKPTALCRSTTVYLDAAGEAAVIPTDIDNGSSDNCMIATYMASPTTFECDDKGLQTVTLTVADPSGNTATCTANVTVADTIAPTFNCPANRILSTEQNCVAFASISPRFLDNCPGGSWEISFSGNPNGVPSDLAGLEQNTGHGTFTYELGITTVTLTGTDSAGNAAKNCIFTVTVEDDDPPSVSCPSNITLANDPGVCSATYSIPDPITDNCSGATWRAIFSGNANGYPSAIFGIPDGSNSAPLSFQIGSTAVSLLGIDGANNSAIPCSFFITVEDTTSPTPGCPSDITVGNDPDQCGAVVTYTISSSDNCAGVSHVQTDVSGFTSGDEFPVGTTMLAYEATDAAGNTASCSFTVTVNDTTPPTINCPSNKTLTPLQGSCSAILSYRIERSDNCTLLASLRNTETFPIGMTTKTFSARDAAGNTSSCSFTVTVTDNEAPTITCPSDITQGNDAGKCSAVVTYSVTSDDNCGASHEETGGSGLSSGDEFPVGITTQTYTASDAGGNTAICSFNITVNDTANPTINCPTGITVGTDPGICGAIVSYSITSDDNCSVSHVQTDMTGRKSGDAFPVGSTLQSFEATDASGNTATCSFTVTVNDTEAPAFNCPSGNVVRNADPGMCDHLAIGQDLDPGVIDNCQVLSALNDYNSAASLAGAVFSKGKTLVTWTAWDVHGNSTSCSYNIRIRDREAPVFGNCPDDTTLIIPAFTGGSYHTWAALTAADNCNSPNKLTITGFPLSGSFFSPGTTTVTWTATDKSNNIGVCEFDVTVEEDGLDAPDGWTSHGLGNAAGCHTHYDTTAHVLTVQSSGGNVSGTADNFCGVAIPHSQSIIDFRARVTPAAAGYYDQAGIMMRQSLANNAKHATMLLTGTSVPIMSLRPSTGSFPLATAGTAVSKPYWLRLYRAGSTITGYVSADGVNWSSIMTYPNLLSSPLYLVLFSTTSGAQGQAIFDHISINGTAVRLGEETIGTELTLKAYPNPFSEDLFIDVENALPGETYQVRLSNMLGQRVYGYETGASPEGRIEQRISLAQLAPGPYLLEVSAGVQRKTIKVQKF